MFTFAVDQDLIEANPAWRIKKPGRERSRDRVLTRDELADRAKKAVAILCKGGVSFHFRAHDLRRTAASYMGEAGVDRFHIAHVLNHRSVTHSTVTAIYDRYRYDKERRAALERWAEVLTEIVDIKPTPTAAPARSVTRANVYEFKLRAPRRAQPSMH